LTTRHNDWELGSGLPDDVDAYIVMARFGWPSEYNNGQTLCLELTLESSDADFDRPVLMPVGNNWTTDRDCCILSHINGKAEAKIIKTSGYGQMIDHVLTVAEAPVEELGSPKDARIWEGLGFHWVRKEISLGAGAEAKGFRASVERLLPVAYLGRRGQENGASPAPSPTTPAPVTAPTPVSEQTGSLVGTLTTMAHRLNQEEFITAALKMDGVTADPALLSQLLDESAAGFWSKAQ
jgi:hypothetical protein